jgi:glycogen operon protein
MFAHGTPMLLAGDEFGRTQKGNNNAYCQDTELSWMDWSQAEAPAGQELTAFVQRLIAIRLEHTALRSRHFLHGQKEPAPGVLDIAWFDESGASIPDDAWTNSELRLLTLRRASANEDGTVSLLTLLLNPTPDSHVFELPQPAIPTRVLVDSAEPLAPEIELQDNKVEVQARSAVLTYAKLERPQ